MADARAVVAAALAVVVLAGGCSDDQDSDQVAAPDGYRSSSCDLSSHGDDATVTLAVPEGAEQTDDCSWSVPGSGDHAQPVSVALTLVGGSDGASLQAERDAQAEFLDVEGDDEVTELRLDEDVAVFGATGDRLRYQCYCDGLPELDYLAQAAGVRLLVRVQDPRARAEVEELLGKVLPTVRVQD